MALHRLATRWQSVLVLVAALGWPVAHVGNLPVVAIPMNFALVVALGGLAWSGGVQQQPEV